MLLVRRTKTPIIRLYDFEQVIFIGRKIKLKISIHSMFLKSIVDLKFSFENNIFTLILCSLATIQISFPEIYGANNKDVVQSSQIK